MLKAKNITKKYRDVEVLKGVDVDISAGEVVSIVGASGAGKSTLLHILGTLDEPDGGNVELEGVNLLSLNDNDLAWTRNTKIGFVFQNHNLFPEFSALENVIMPALIGGASQSIAENKAKDLLKILGVDHRASHKPGQLSGGEQQRVSVARSLINDPKIIFADEPSGNLDSSNAGELHQLFFRLREKLGQTFVIVTHNKEFADMADRKLTIADGLVK